MESVHFYESPFWKAQSTFENIVSNLLQNQFRYNEESGFCEKEWRYLFTERRGNNLKHFITTFRIVK